MKKKFVSLGLMSGTSGDGVDSSLIETNGEDKCKVICNNYHPYTSHLSREIKKMRDLIIDYKDLKKFKKKIEILEGKITNFHLMICEEWQRNYTFDLVGLHGHTIYHNSQEKISIQLGIGNIISENLKKNVIYNFRQEDIENGGEGAPLSPIYHKQLIKNCFKKKKLKLPLSILNIGGISNITNISKNFSITSKDLGPGNCLIDKWISINSKHLFDKDGKIAKLGKPDQYIINQFLDNYFSSKISKKKSFDINDFDINFARGLNLYNGAATLTNITSEIILNSLPDNNIFLCGGGRKNNYLVNLLKTNFKKKIFSIDELEIDGDFVESQAFAYLSVRSYLNLPLSFPSTTGCIKPCSGGKKIIF